MVYYLLDSTQFARMHIIFLQHVIFAGRQTDGQLNAFARKNIQDMV